MIAKRYGATALAESRAVYPPPKIGSEIQVERTLSPLFDVAGVSRTVTKDIGSFVYVGN